MESEKENANMKRVSAVNAPGGKIVAYSFVCPGCGYKHTPYIEEGYGPKWGFNGSEELPTFTPSILFRTGDKNGPIVCHSFVTDGRIQFLTDSTHKLAGQTVDLNII